MVSDIDNCSDSYIYRSICGENRNNGEREGSAGIRTYAQDSDLIRQDSSNDREDSSNDGEDSLNDIDDDFYYIDSDAKDIVNEILDSLNDLIETSQTVDIIAAKDILIDIINVIITQTIHIMDGQAKANIIDIIQTLDDIFSIDIIESLNDIDDDFYYIDALNAQDSSNDREDSSNDEEDSLNDIDAQDSDLIRQDSFNKLKGEDSLNDRENSSNDGEGSSNDGEGEDSLNDRENSSNDGEGSSNDRKDPSTVFSPLWVVCKNCNVANFHKSLKENRNICYSCEKDVNEEGDGSFSLKNNSNDFSHLWIQCENCDELNYKRFFKKKLNICEGCGWHLKMNSPDRLDLSIDPDTWGAMDEDMVSLDPIKFVELISDSGNKKENKNEYKNEYENEYECENENKNEYKNENKNENETENKNENKNENEYENENRYECKYKFYKDRLEAYQTKTGLPDAVQTGIGELNGIPVAVGVMDFEFIGGSMGSVVGEKITRLIEYATNQFLPLIIVCASGGARMQEGSVSLMQMAKISSALYDYQSNKKLFYISILASPTTGGVMASFGTLADIVIAEPNACIAFAGKRVIEQTLKIEVPEGVQETEYLFEKGSFDLIVPRKFLKSVLTELLKLHGFFPLTKNANQNQIEG
uniref:Acetyl-coenzyme A carboxylase carboxyl transferase subunit beta, chloroplastic n=1 Tax=Pergularia tomentosa TaxID=264979 RepID=A0A7G6KG09_9GENT|nr:acetyl-CoA carboxylase beta subunit [Pergularia tomentosa]QNC66179.1 acetyl-CoA carboxylase beta subunit [Pergularia tomentosa]